MRIAVFAADHHSTSSTLYFTVDEIAAWKPKIFSGKTLYRAMDRDGHRALQAKSKASASGLVKRIKVDLSKTPILNWSWKVEKPLAGIDETTKAGDDYAARVYVVFSGGLLFWKTRALSYVWASGQPRGAAWPNAFTANAHMIAIESGQSALGKWVHHKRNIKQDVRRYFGKDKTAIDAIAIMTDTDNSGQSAIAYYGDIYFTAE